jgi:hypothetical protein
MLAPGAQQLEAFRDYTTGGAVSVVLLGCGLTLLWAASRGRAQK